MPLPPAHMLVGAAAAEAVATPAGLSRYRAWVVGAAFGLLPDVDFAYRILTRDDVPFERSATHSLAATFVVLGIVTLIAGRRWGAVAGAAYASHLLIDLMQYQARTSVALLWPLQQQGMAPILPLFPNVPTQRGEGLRGAVLALFEGYPLIALMQETAIAAAFFFAVLVATNAWRGRRAR